MASESASIIALLLYALALSPVAVLALRPRTGRWLAPLSAALISAFAFFQTGAFQDSSLASPDVAELMKADTPAGRCQEVFTVLGTNGILLEKPDGDGITVRGKLWDQLPAPVREAVTVCAQAAGAGEPGGEVPIVRR